jgi:hypothetical protein
MGNFFSTPVQAIKDAGSSITQMTSKLTQGTVTAPSNVQTPPTTRGGRKSKKSKTLLRKSKKSKKC